MNWSSKREWFDLLWNSLNSVFKEMYGDPFGDVVCRYWELKGETMTGNLAGILLMPKFDRGHKNYLNLNFCLYLVKRLIVMFRCAVNIMIGQQNHLNITGFFLYKLIWQCYLFLVFNGLSLRHSSYRYINSYSYINC